MGSVTAEINQVYRLKTDKLVPCKDPHLAVRMQKPFFPGSYVKGKVVAEVVGSGTAVNCQQTITITGTPTGGTFTLTFNGQTTAAIAYNASAATVAAALEALSNIGTGNVSCTGGAFPGTAVVVNFIGDLAGRPVYTMTATGSLTGGSTPAVAVALTTAGNYARGYYRSYVDGTYDPAKGATEFALNVREDGLINVGPGEAGYTDTVASIYVAGFFKAKELIGLDSNGVTDLGKMVQGSTASLTTDEAVIHIR